MIGHSGYFIADTTARLGAQFAVRDEPGITRQRLARTLGLREPAVTGPVGRLTAAGLVTKSTHPREHRAVVLELTDSGTEALREVDRFDADLREVLGEDGFTGAATAMHRLAYWES
ncbi:MarR family winged helix-turn-helix transcriptional regulator [Streptomyces sp. SLBN-8D4]|uniref:MarR family winged helix-turn-helix transcriptional regulator n=1 Tax=Streptomyces sp. SLBN-8D4 TaxID=3377728 RepID=UPI003C7AF58F